MTTTNRVTYETGAIRETQTGKGRFDLVSPFALQRLADRYEHGVIKYDEKNPTLNGKRKSPMPNMRLGMPLSRMICSGQHHWNLFALLDESEDHLAAAMWNASEAIHALELIKRAVLPADLDDRAEILGLIRNGGA